MLMRISSLYASNALLRSCTSSSTDMAAGEKQGKNAAFREAIEHSQLEVHQAQESTRMDDNGVNITEQAVELARNGYQLQYVMDSISSDFSILRTAIRG